MIFLKNKGIKNESRISIVLNTFMYIDKCIPFVELGGTTLKEIVDQLVQMCHFDYSNNNPSTETPSVSENNKQPENDNNDEPIITNPNNPVIPSMDYNKPSNNTDVNDKENLYQDVANSSKQLPSPK